MLKISARSTKQLSRNNALLAHLSDFWNKILVLYYRLLLSYVGGQHLQYDQIFWEKRTSKTDIKNTNIENVRGVMRGSAQKHKKSAYSIIIDIFAYSATLFGK